PGSFKTPSRSRNTAGRLSRTRLTGRGPCAGFAHHRLERGPHGVSRRHLVAPAQGADPRGVETHDGDVTLPAAVASGEVEGNAAGGPAGGRDGELRDVSHGDVVTSRHVVGVEAVHGALR